MQVSVKFDGKLPLEEIRQMMSSLETLASQPPLPIHNLPQDKNPRVNYRIIFVTDDPRFIPWGRYHVSDIGIIDEKVPNEVLLGSKFYSAEEVTKLMR